MKQTIIVCLFFVFWASTSVFAQNQRPAAIGKAPTRTATEKVVLSKMTREATIALHQEIEQNLNNPAYHRQAALQTLFTSPFVYRGLNVVDETFPIQILTGDKQADTKTYTAMKSEWITQNPERYAALKRNKE